MAVTAKTRASSAEAVRLPAETEGGKGTMGDYADNAALKAYEHYANAARSAQLALQQSLMEAVAQYTNALRSIEESARSLGTEAQQRFLEALHEAYGDNDSLEQYRKSVQQWSEAAERAQAELRDEKAAADLRLLTALYEAQGKPDQEERFRRAVDQHLSSLQEACKRSSATALEESSAACHQAYREACEYGRKRALSACGVLGEALTKIRSEVAQSSQGAVEKYLKAQQEAWSTAQEAARHAGIEALQHLQPQKG